MNIETVQQILDKHQNNGDELVAILEDIQAAFTYLPEEALRLVADEIGHSLVDIYGVATFYNQFRLNAPGKIQIQVCRGTACHVKGSLDLLNSVKRLIGIEVGETTKDGLFSLETVACLGGCSIAPVITANGRFFGRLDKKRLESLVAKFREAGEVVE